MRGGRLLVHHLSREALVRRDLDVLHEGEERVLRLFVVVAAPGHAHAHAARDVADALRPHELCCRTEQTRGNVWRDQTMQQIEKGEHKCKTSARMCGHGAREQDGKRAGSQTA